MKNCARSHFSFQAPREGDKLLRNSREAAICTSRSAYNREPTSYINHPQLAPQN